MSTNVVLRLTDIVKSYPGVRALKGVSLEVTAGVVHALVGENGAGKSTLMGIAAGAIAPDSGRVAIAGTPLDQASPARAAALGISVVYQRPAILSDLTVEENLLLAVPRHRRAAQPAPDWVAHQLVGVGANFDAATRAGELSLSQRELLELAKALASDPKVLVLDEPSEALSHVETERLFQMIERIRHSGAAVIYISHRLPDIKRVASRVTVLRDGEAQGTFDTAAISEDEILRLILGRSVDRAFAAKPQRRDSVRTAGLEVRGLLNDRLDSVSLSIASGEIVGFAGVDGNGQRACLRAVAGLEAATGEVLIDGRKVNPAAEMRRRQGGIVFLPAERHEEGLFMSLSVRENLAALVLSQLGRFGVVSPSRETRLVDNAVTELGIKAPSSEARVSSLSGGNQQKVLFARSLARQPAVLLADEPTRGVDAGARLELYRILREVADAGAAVAVCSSDTIELEGLCDRVLVFSRGMIVAVLDGDDATQQRITAAAFTHQRRGKTSEDRRADDERRKRLRRFAEGDYLPSLVIALVIAALALYVNSTTPFFLGGRNINGVLFLATALGFVSIAQLVVVLAGGIDLAVGPLAGLVVVVLSFFAGAAASAGSVISGLLLALVVSVSVGLLHGLLIRKVGLSPVVTTLATYIGLQGVSLTLRPTPVGYIGPDLASVLEQKIGPIPVAFMGLTAVAVVAELWLRRTRPGIGLRAVGSDEVSALRLGARVNLLVIGAYVGASIFAGAAGVLLTAQVGVGDPTVGITYTLQSITVVVLGGIGISGGRGSFISTVLAAVLFQELTSATQFLGLSTAWQYWFPGLIILLAAALFSGTRNTHGARHPVASTLAQLAAFIRAPSEPHATPADEAETHP